MVNQKKPELLCPVGGKEQLIAAVENGADAVYLGGSEFNARMYADNFDDIKKLEEAIDYAHLRNVNVYVTLNTLINDEEIDRAVDYAKELYKIGVDSVIVQDLGLIDRISKELPSLKIHVSTQATVYSKEGISYFNKNNNIDRIVLARELSIDEIEDIVNSVDKEIEIFVHGALCVCYSGQCKLSSAIGGRSGNRGKCAQPCRLPYRILNEQNNQIEDEDYYLSVKDICTIDILPKILESGVSSLKIEGRMKSPEYVAIVTSIYRKYIDKYFSHEEYIVDDEDKYKLMQVFNRGAFETGYLEEKNSKKLWCNTRPKHWGTYLGQVIDYNKKRKNIKIKLEQDLLIGDGIEVVNNSLPGGIVSFIRNKNEIIKEAKKGQIVEIGDIKGNIEKGQQVYKISSKKLNESIKPYINGKVLRKNDTSCYIKLEIDKKIYIELKCNIFNEEYEIKLSLGDECQKSINKAYSKEEVIDKLMKTGDIPFELKEINVEMDENLFTTASNINFVRRTAFDMLSKKIIESFKHGELQDYEEQNNIDTNIIKDRETKTKLSGYIYNIDLLDNLEELYRLDRVYISLENIIKYKEDLLNKISKDKIFIYLPTITSKQYKTYIYNNMSVIEEIRNLVITNIEHLKMFEKYKDINIVLDNSFNVFNSNSVKTMYDEGIRELNLSNELTLEQIENIKVPNKMNIEVDVYGNIGVMYSNFCSVGAKQNKNKCGMCKKGRYVLKDRKDKEFPLLFNNIDCNMKILNGSKLFSKEAVKRLNGKVDYMRIYIYDENIEERKKVIDIFKRIINNQDREIDNLSSNNKVQYTNGFFYKQI